MNIFGIELIGTTKTIFLVALILIITFTFARFFNRTTLKIFERYSKKLKVDPTQYNFVRHLIVGIIYILGITAAIYTVPSFRALAVSIFAGAGILAVIIGFASQQAFANIVSGIFIAIFKPLRVGDKIEISTDVKGTVEDINLRHTVIRNYENERIIIPNSILSNEKIVNLSISDQKICRYVEFGISYDSDVDKAINIIQQETKKHPSFLDNRDQEQKKAKENPVPVRMTEHGDFYIRLRAYVWAIDPPTAFKMKTDLLKSVKKRFDKEGIEIPFPYRTIVYKKDLKRK